MWTYKLLLPVVVILSMIGQLALAARFLGAVEAVLETFFKPLDDWDQKEYDLITGKLRALDETALTAAWAEGRKLNLEQAVAYALEEHE